MKVFVSVLALVAVASAAVVADEPVQPVEQSSVQPPVQQPIAQPMKPETQIDPASLLLTLYSAPSYVHHYGKKHEIGGMKRIVEGPVLVAFHDVALGKMQAFFLRKGFFKEYYTLEEILPLAKYLGNGRKKAFLYPSAAVYLRAPELTVPLTDIHMPSYNLEYAFSVSQEYSSYPYIIIVDQESLLTNSKDKFDNLTEVGVFGLEEAGLKIIRDNHVEHHGHHGLHFRKDFDAVAVVTPVPSVPYKTFDLIDLGARRLTSDFPEERTKSYVDFAHNRKSYVDFTESRKPYGFAAPLAHDFPEQRTIDFPKKYVAAPFVEQRAQPYIDFAEQGESPYSIASSGFQDDAVMAYNRFNNQGREF